MIGAFWTPGATGDKPDTGTLAADDHHITLTTAPVYRELKPTDLKAVFESMQALKTETVETVHGRITEGDCTLCSLFEAENPGFTDMRVNKSVTAVVYRCSICLVGMHIAGLDDRCIDSAQYSFRNWHQWLPSYVSEVWDKDAVVIRVPNEPREIASTQFENQPIRVKIKLMPVLGTDADTGGRLTHTVGFIEVLSSEKQSLDWYLHVAGRLENLFSLLTGTSLALDTMFVYRDKQSGHINQKRNSTAGEFDFQAAVHCNSTQLGTAMKIWLSEDDRFQSVESLALGVLRKQKLFVETEFLSLAQALEGFHRGTAENTGPNKLAIRNTRKAIAKAIKNEPIDETLKERICESVSFANEPTLASRLQDLCSRFSPETLTRMKLDPAIFVPNVVLMRNYYTHAGGRARNAKKVPLAFLDLFSLTRGCGRYFAG